MDVRGLPTKKCPGVSVSKSSKFDVKGVSGREFSTASISRSIVMNSSRVKCAFPTTLFKWNLNAFTPASHSPPVAAVAEWYRYRTVACFVTGSNPVPLKTRRVGQRCTLNLSRAETSSRWCGVVVRREGCQLRCRPRHLTMVQNYVVRRQKPSCS
ncbi:uncharacterized protein TNCV_1287871 [Trichonephila clavipes]|nr:uncharacterized protein TNCV_1287871 [Trichonephila clavipes]